MHPANPAHDPVERAREEYFALRGVCAALEARLAALDHRQPADLADVVENVSTQQTRERATQARRACDAAHAALGRALLEQFTEDVGALAEETRRAGRAGEAAWLSEASELERNFRRACLKVMERWPELADEAARRLQGPATGDAGQLMH